MQGQNSSARMTRSRSLRAVTGRAARWLRRRVAKLGAGSRGPWTMCWTRCLSRVGRGSRSGGNVAGRGTNVGRDKVPGQVRGVGERV